MLSEQKITDYWFSLFPELIDKKALDTLLNRVMDDNLTDLSQRRINESFYHKGKTAKLVEYIFNLEKHYELEAFTNKYMKKISQYKFFEPLINMMFCEYFKKYKKINQVTSFDNIIFNCLEQISKYAVKVLVLDINYMKENEQLVGDSSQERYMYYENKVLNNREYVKDIYSHYYELARIMYNTIKKSCEYYFEIVNKFEKDKTSICKELNINDECSILEINIGSGDSHEGKSVATVLLTNNMKIMYKPHTLKMDKCFYNMIQWINKTRSNYLLELYLPNVLSKDGYGWSFFVTYKEVETFKELERFYIRAGQLLCLLYMMNAVDCHYENIIAFGEYPTVIDMETLIHPTIKGHHSGMQGKDILRNKSEEYKTGTVLGVGLLPNFIIGGDNNSDRIDISGLSNIDNSFFPFKSMQLTNINTDDIKVERDYGRVINSKNCPQYNGQKYELKDYIKEFIFGFSNMYDWILNNKSKMINYINDNYRNIDVRVLFRATHIYSRLLATSMHPDFLADDVSRAILLSRIGINASPEYYDIISLEYKSLLNNDIPYFTCKTHQKSVVCYDYLLDNKLEESPLESLLYKINLFSDWDKQQQIYYIEMSNGLKRSNRVLDETTTSFELNLDEKETLNIEEQVNIAKDIADYLLQHAIIISYNNMECMNWLTSSLDSKCDKPSLIVPVGYDLYSGVSGIGEFFIKLSIITKESKYLKGAEKCVNSIISVIECYSKDNASYSLGMHNGISGYLLFLYDVYNENHSPILYDNINKLFDLIENEIYRATIYDIVGGIAGCINVLLYIWKRNDIFKEKCEVLIEKCTFHLLQNATFLPNNSVRWDSSIDENHYSGYAHGVSGIIAQLSNANMILQLDEIDKIIRKSLQHERSFFDSNLKNWYIDQRYSNIGNGWCHGAPGILLEKSILKNNKFSEELIEYEYNIALKNTIQHSFGCTPNFCHGDIGNLDIVYRAALSNNDDCLAKKCLDIFNVFIQDTLLKHYKGRAFRGTEVVGMMLGTSGLGYSILRFAYPDIVSSIL